MRRLLPVLLFCFTSLLSLSAQENGDDLLNRIQEAVEVDFFDKALTLMEKGIRDYPGDIRFPMARGDLYESRELYSLALDSYRIAESHEPGDRELRKKLASTLAYLDRNYQALDYLEDLVEEGETVLLDDLGWMYYKTHQPDKGILLLKESLEKNFDRNLSLTLGTLYSDLNEAGLCRKYYLDAIQDALENQDSYFASVGYYNLSLAEKSFYDYDAAEKYASLSLELMNRSGGHLALGDLYLMRHSFSRAEEEFLEAVELDETPLSRSNLATLYRNSGSLIPALQQLRKIEETKDDSWMYYYGLNREQFTLDLYDQYQKVYEGLYRRAGVFRVWGVREGVDRLFQILSFRIKSSYYKIVYRIMAYREGSLQLEGGSILRGNLTLAAAAEGFPSQAVRYYGNASALEEFDQADPWYDMVLGREMKDTEQLLRSIAGFDPAWELQPAEDALRELALLEKRGDPLFLDSILMQIYSRNPGGLVQYGLRLPLSVQFSGTESDPSFKRRIRRLLKGSGFLLRDQRPGIPTLRINRGEILFYSLTDSDGSVLVSGSHKEEDLNGDGLVHWVYTFRDAVFSP